MLFEVFSSLKSGRVEEQENTTTTTTTTTKTNNNNKTKTKKYEKILNVDNNSLFSVLKYILIG